ncbi:MAG: hypothetical protein AAF557_21950 [Pseudomonadota bacterium]
MDQNHPLDTLRDGRLKATVWENQNESGETYHTVSLAKTYEDRNGKLQDSHSFSGSELLRVAELAREAHGVIREVRREIAQERNAERSAAPQGQPVREDQPSRFRGRRTSSQP